MRLRKEIRGGSDGFDRILMSASGPGCVKTRLSQGRAELFSNCLLLTEVASAIGFPQRRNRDGNSTRNFNVGVFTQPGSDSDLTAPMSDFRFTPQSRLKPDIAGCPKSAMNGSRRAHSITSSAVARSAGGIKRLSVFAVLRLMTSSYF